MLIFGLSITLKLSLTLCAPLQFINHSHQKTTAVPVTFTVILGLHTKTPPPPLAFWFFAGLTAAGCQSQVKVVLWLKGAYSESNSNTFYRCYCDSVLHSLTFIGMGFLNLDSRKQIWQLAAYCVHLRHADAHKQSKFEHLVQLVPWLLFRNKAKTGYW